MSAISSTMPVVAPTSTTSPPLPPRVRRITVGEYERIIRSGSLDDPDRVELIDGYMVDKMGKSAEHGYATRQAIDELGGLLGQGWIWRSEQPVRIPNYDEPEPDLAIVRGSKQDYRHEIPAPPDIALLIEVSLTTLDMDRGKKLMAYALGGIPVYWIINLADRQIEVYSGPGSSGYQARTDYRTGQTVPVVIGGQVVGQVAVDDILP